MTSVPEVITNQVMYMPIIIKNYDVSHLSDYKSGNVWVKNYDVSHLSDYKSGTVYAHDH